MSQVPDVTARIQFHWAAKFHGNFGFIRNSDMMREDGSQMWGRMVPPEFQAR
jgi:hypothetical protein